MPGYDLASLTEKTGKSASYVYHMRVHLWVLVRKKPSLPLVGILIYL